MAPAVVWLIVGRSMQGAELGIVPLGLAILRDNLPRERLGTAIALISATMGTGAALALPLSAFIAERFDWRLLFWMSAALSALALIAVALVVPASRFAAGGRFDFPGAVGLSNYPTEMLLNAAGVSRNGGK